MSSIWARISATEITWNGTVFVVHDMGGGGHCLFLSLSLVFAVEGAAAASHRELRADTVDQLISWCFNLPAWFDGFHYEPPHPGRIVNLVNGDWGDLTCMLALLAKRYPDYCI